MTTGFENDKPQAPDDDDEVTGAVSRPELAPSSHPPETASTSDHQWYIAAGGAQFGPLGTAELRCRLAAGAFPEDATVWHSGLSEWEEWGWIPELRAQAEAPPPPRPPEGPATLSPVVEEMASEPRRRFLGVSPWYAMIAAVPLGIGVSFIVLRFVAGESSEEPTVSETASEPLSVELSVKGALRPEEVQARLGNLPPEVGLACWNEALKSRQPNASATASLVVKLEVDTTGYVTGVRSVADPPGYPGLAACIAGRTRGWRFPAGSGTSTVSLRLGFR